jgi:signal transduction histidine kinase
MPIPAKITVTWVRKIAWQYGISVAVFLLAILLTELLWHFIRPMPLPLYFAPIVAAFWCGFGPGLFVAVLSALTLDYYYVVPYGYFDWTTENLVRVIVFLAVSAAISWFNGSRKRLMDEREGLLNQISGFNDQLRRDIEAATKELATANDVLFKTQQRLARSERLAVVGQITASLAHEIGTPLNSISGHLELLAANHPADADTQRRTLIIERQLSFIVATVKRLLEWTHKRRLAFEPLEINALIEELLWLVSPTLEKNSVVATLKRDDKLPLIPAHRDSLQQVFLNLINNSIEAMPGGGNIEITTILNTAIDRVEILFCDSGPGIAPDAAQHLFEPMWTTKPSGSGFGLVIAEEIMTDHAGDIAFVENDGRGAMFRLTLPLLQGEMKQDYQQTMVSNVA